MTHRERPPRVSAALFDACGYFLPRLMFLQARYAPQVHWGDITQALDGFPCTDIELSSSAFWDEWRIRWTAQGDRYQQVATESTTRAGCSRAHRSAAACYHWAEFMYFDDPMVKFGLRSKTRSSFQQSLEGAGLDITPGALISEPDGTEIPYWLLLPDHHRRGQGPLPCVILSNGLDSMTEVEVLALAETFLERGIATVLFEGPGQGLSVGQMPLKPDMEQVIAQLAAFLQKDSRIAPDRLGFLGVSFGGYFALRVAQRLGESFKCVVNLSGGPQIAPFATLPRRLKDDFLFAFQANAASMQDRFDELALHSDAPIATDVLSIHGELDDIFPLSALSALDRQWGQRHQLLTHRREAHVCLNLINSCSLEAADWTADRLLPSP
uniref:Alpha/beta hydrolase n=1 Tax=Streptomyces sp. NBC_00003 TaxID=2903608 RepID=A0AAU2VDZ3_9ACTN